MGKTIKRPLALLLALLLGIFGCMFLAHGIQTNHGAVAVSTGSIAIEGGHLTYKLYVPETASAEAPAPGVLLLHGYQNDRETCAAYAIELARRGAVVLSLDEYGHGGTDVGMARRGYVNHRVKVNFGEESEADGTFVSVGGPSRFRLMMNFSNLSFFDDSYSKDSDGNAILDSSCGGIAAYGVLADMPCVDPSRLAVSGHSMGTWSSWSVAAAYAGKFNMDGVDISPKATVLQCGELFRDSVYDSDAIYFNNVLLLQAKYDEFSYFRDYQNFVDDSVLHSDLRAEFLGCAPEDAAWDTTFGSFADGTARRMEYLETNHRLTTHDTNGLAVALDWFDAALDLDPIPADDQVAMTKEWLVFAAMLMAIAAMLPLMELLLQLPFFRSAAKPLPSRDGILSRKSWRKNAAVTMFLAGATYPFMTQLGHGLFPFPEGIFRMTIGNGFLCWYLLLIVIMLVTTGISLKKAKKQGTALWDSLGLAGPGHAESIDWGLCGKSALLTVCMVGMLYGLVAVFEAAFLLDFRFIWPFFKTFSLARFGQFLVYLPFFALFFLLSGSKIFAGMRTEATYQPGVKGFLATWWRSALLMVGGVLVIVLIEYVPFFAGIGPGADLLFSSTFGGPFMSILIVFVPQVLVFSLLCTYIYRRTGNVYTGAFTVASMAAWIITGGSAML
ncbi:MAG: alpha/beta hydrolase [Oscillospiraceae bacterium]|nr:alpha/beta hydrolase [Oscillospiraceae bacterium]